MGLALLKEKQLSMVAKTYNTVNAKDGVAESPDYSVLYQRTTNLTGIYAGEIPQNQVSNFIDPTRNIIAANSITTRSLSVGNKTWTSNVVWNNATLNQISWNEHTLVLSDGNVVTITAGSHSTMDTSSRFYIYYKAGTTEYRVTTTSTTATGPDRFIVASFKNNSDGKITIYPFDTFGTLISGDIISTGRIQSSDGRTYFDLDDDVIVINDGSNDRVLIGFQSGGF